MKKGWIIALALLLLGGGGAFVWYNRLKSEAAAGKGPYDNTLKPRLEMSNMSITNIDDQKVDMTVRMLIDNPLPVGFKAKRLTYKVLMANTPIVEDAYAKAISINSGDSTYVTLPMKLLLNKLATVLKTLDKKGIDSTTYTVRSTFDLDVPILGERTFTSTITKRLPTLYIPEVKVEHIDLGKIGLKRTDIAAKVNIRNKNKFPFNITDTHYSVTIDGKQIAKGYQPDPILIKAQATTPVIFPVTARPGKTLSVLPKVLFDKKNTSYTVDFTCKLVDKSGNLAFKNSKLTTTIKGTLADLKDIADKASAKADAQKDADRAQRKEIRQEKRAEKKAERQQRREEHQSGVK